MASIKWTVLGESYEVVGDTEDEAIRLHDEVRAVNGFGFDPKTQDQKSLLFSIALPYTEQSVKEFHEMVDRILKESGNEM